MSGKLERITLGEIEEVAGKKAAQTTASFGPATVKEPLLFFDYLILTIANGVLTVPVSIKNQPTDTMESFLSVIDKYLAQTKRYLVQVSELGTKWPDRKYIKGTLYQE